MGNLFRRVLAFTLGVVIGVVALAGAIVGGAIWAYTTFKPVQAVAGDTQGLGDFSDSTVQDLVELVKRGLDNPDDYTLNRLEKEYGLDLKVLLKDVGVDTEDVDSDQWDALASISLFSLIKNPEKFLDTVKLKALYVFLPSIIGCDVSDILSTEAQSKLGDYTVSQLLATDEFTGEMGIMKAIKNLKIGSLLPSMFKGDFNTLKHEYTYELKPDNENEILGLLGNVEVNAVLDLMDGADPITLLMEGGLRCIADKEIAEILNMLGGDSGTLLDSIAKAVGHATIADLFVKENGTYVFSYDKVASDVQIGYLFNYTRDNYGMWYEDAEMTKPVVGVMNSICGSNLMDILNNTDDIASMLKAVAGSASIADILNTVDPDGKYPSLCDLTKYITINDLLEGGIDNITTNLINGIKESPSQVTFADVIKDLAGSDIFTGDAEKFLTGMENVKIAEFLKSSDTEDAALELFAKAFGYITVGDLMGNQRDDNGEWIADSPLQKLILNVNVAGIYTALKNQNDTMAMLKAVLGDCTAGDVFGAMFDYTYDSNLKTWKNADGLQVTDDFAKALELKVWQIAATFDANSDVSVYSEIENLQIGDIIVSMLQALKQVPQEIKFNGGDYVVEGDLKNAVEKAFAVTVGELEKNRNDVEYWKAYFGDLKVGDIGGYILNNNQDIALTATVDAAGNWFVTGGDYEKVYEKAFNIYLRDLFNPSDSFIADHFGDLEIGAIVEPSMLPEDLNNQFVSASLKMTVSDVLRVLDATTTNEARYGLLANVYAGVPVEALLSALKTEITPEAREEEYMKTLLSADLGMVFADMAIEKYQYVGEILVTALEGVKPEEQVWVLLIAGELGLLMYYSDNEGLVKLMDDTFPDKTVGEVFGKIFGYRFDESAGTYVRESGLPNTFLEKLMGEKLSVVVNANSYADVGGHKGYFKNEITIANVITLHSQIESLVLSYGIDLAYDDVLQGLAMSGKFSRISARILNFGLGEALNEGTSKKQIIKDMLGEALLGDFIAPVSDEMLSGKFTADLSADKQSWEVTTTNPGQEQVYENALNMTLLDFYDGIKAYMDTGDSGLIFDIAGTAKVGDVLSILKDIPYDANGVYDYEIRGVSALVNRMLNAEVSVFNAGIRSGIRAVYEDMTVGEAAANIAKAILERVGFTYNAELVGGRWVTEGSFVNLSDKVLNLTLGEVYNVRNDRGVVTNIIKASNIGDFVADVFKLGLSKVPSMDIANTIELSSDNTNWIVVGDYAKLLNKMFNINIGQFFEGLRDETTGGKAYLYGPEVLGDIKVGDITGNGKYVYSEALEAWVDNATGAPITFATEAEKIMMTRVYNISLADAASGAFNMDELFGDLYLGQLLGYSCSLDGQANHVHSDACAWQEEAEVVIDGTFAPTTMLVNVGAIDNAIAGICLGDILKGNPISADTILGDASLGDLMGLISAQEDDGGSMITVWYQKKTESTYDVVDADGNYVKGEKCANLYQEIGSIKVDSLMGENGLENIMTELKGMPIGDLLEYKFDASTTPGVWKDAANNEITGLMQKMAGYSINQIENDFDSLVQDWTLTDVLPDATVNGSALLRLVKDTKIQNLDAELEAMQIGSIMGYIKDAGTNRWYVDNAGTPDYIDDPIILILCEYYVGNLTGEMELRDSDGNVTSFSNHITNRILTTVNIGHFFPDAGKSDADGFMALIDPTWKLNELSENLMSKLKTGTSIDQLIGFGVFGDFFDINDGGTYLTTEEENYKTMDNLFASQAPGGKSAREYWLGLTMPQFLEGMLNIINAYTTFAEQYKNWVASGGQGQAPQLPA